jgi:hypothetical protein
MGDFAERLTLDQIADNRKAMRMLGWQPRHLNFVDDVETYFVSWKASSRVRNDHQSKGGLSHNAVVGNRHELCL